MTSGMKDTPLPWEVEKRIIEVLMIGLEVCVIGSSNPKWASDVIRYLEIGELLELKEEVKRTRRKVARFVKVDGVLYKRGFSTPYFNASYHKKHNTTWLKCIKGYVETIQARRR